MVKRAAFQTRSFRSLPAGCRAARDTSRNAAARCGAPGGAQPGECDRSGDSRHRLGRGSRSGEWKRCRRLGLSQLRNLVAGRGGVAGAGPVAAGARPRADERGRGGRHLPPAEERDGPLARSAVPGGVPPRRRGAGPRHAPSARRGGRAVPLTDRPGRHAVPEPARHADSDRRVLPRECPARAADAGRPT